MEFLYHSANVLLGTLKDVLPIIGVIVFFQLVIIRKKIDNPRRLIYGFCLVIVGLSIFMIGLNEGLFPLGETMSRQLTNFHFLAKGNTSLLEEIKATGAVYPLLYFWTYIFGFCIGFSTTIAEPALLAVALKAEEVSTGAISPWGLVIPDAANASHPCDSPPPRAATRPPPEPRALLPWVRPQPCRLPPSRRRLP